MQELARVGDVVERYYDQFYLIDESGQMEDHYIHLHVNGLCVVRVSIRVQYPTQALYLCTFRSVSPRAIQFYASG